MRDLSSDPQAREILADQDAVRQVLRAPEAAAILSRLQGQDTAALQSAARSALQGDAAALETILTRLSQDPETARSIQALEKKLKP